MATLGFLATKLSLNGYLPDLYIRFSEIPTHLVWQGGPNKFRICSIFDLDTSWYSLMIKMIKKMIVRVLLPVWFRRSERQRRDVSRSKLFRKQSRVPCALWSMKLFRSWYKRVPMYRNREKKIRFDIYCLDHGTDLRCTCTFN